jgi:2,4-didehydro-3-deoxy-L-rhamnonate hydrolase
MNQQHLVRAKSRPTYSPIGPYLATGSDAMQLDVWTKVNGHYEQQGNTNDMLFPVYEMLAYFSRHLRWFQAMSWQPEPRQEWVWAKIGF